MVRVSPCLLAALTACYRPAPDPACAISCASAACPSGLSCGPDQKCFTTGGDDCTGAPVFDAPAVDGVADAASDAQGKDCTGTLYGSGGMLSVCVVTPLQTSLLLSTSTESTDGPGTPTPCFQILRPANGPEVCVIAAQDLTVSGSFRAIGSRPLMLFAQQSLLIGMGSVVDVSSGPASTGAGAASACIPGAQPGTDTTSGFTTGAGGGAGAAYGGDGGAGGNGTYDGGVMTSHFAVAAVVGGCPGAPGGLQATHTGGAGGFGGGAVYLLAGGSMTIAGAVNASGAGGYAPAGPYAGGGGGGAGGFIGLDANSYAISTAALYAVGGGGSTGGGFTGGGVQGATAQGPAMTAQANSSDGGGSGGPGSPGNGIAGGQAVCSGMSACAGGGGGGGGGGYILINNVSQISPSPNFAPMPIEMPP